jgi:hypothetical protein
MLWDTGRVTGSMIAYACLLLAATGTNAPFVDEDRYPIRAGDLAPVTLSLRQIPAVVTASYSVEGSAQVRIALMTQQDWDRADNIPGRVTEDALLASTARGKSGSFTYQVPHKGDYVILMDNRADKQNAAMVHMRVMWEYPRVSRLSPERQFTVIAISFLAFFAVVTYSARKLLKATRT